MEMLCRMIGIYLECDIGQVNSVIYSINLPVFEITYVVELRIVIATHTICSPPFGIVIGSFAREARLIGVAMLMVELDRHTRCSIIFNLCCKRTKYPIITCRECKQVGITLLYYSSIDIALIVANSCCCILVEGCITSQNTICKCSRMVYSNTIVRCNIMNTCTGLHELYIPKCLCFAY